HPDLRAAGLVEGAEEHAVAQYRQPRRVGARAAGVHVRHPCRALRRSVARPQLAVAASVDTREQETAAERREPQWGEPRTERDRALVRAVARPARPLRAGLEEPPRPDR